MKRMRIALTLIGAVSLAVMGLGCSSDPNDKLGGGGNVATDPNSAAGGADNTYNHDFSNPGAEQGGVTGGNATNDDPGGPVAAARYHGCAKITYAALGSILSTRGAKLTGNDNALTLYKSSGASLGVANYSGRVPEALIGSTSAIAKQFDIFIAAAPEIETNAGTMPACQGVTIADATTGKFTKDGVSCLMGKLATDEHVAVANQAVTDAVKGGATQSQGVSIAIAAIMEAAHTCE
jgi:hypothetical protein